jgi:hypothetical protein
MERVCPSCNAIDRLENCFECLKLICKRCIQIHYDKWKLEANKECSCIEINLKCYKDEIGKTKVH